MVVLGSVRLLIGAVAYALLSRAIIAAPRTRTDEELEQFD